MEPQSIFGRRPAEGSYRITPREKKEWMKMFFLSENFLNSPLGPNERFQWESTPQGDLDDIDDMITMLPAVLTSLVPVHVVAIVPVLASSHPTSG